MTLLAGLAEKTLLVLEERALCLFILLASPKKKPNKQTNKQKERWQGHRNSCGQLQRACVEESISTTITTKRIGSRTIFYLFSVWKCILRPLQNDYRTGGKATFLIDPQMVNEKNILGNKNVLPFFCYKATKRVEWRCCAAFYHPAKTVNNLIYCRTGLTLVVKHATSLFNSFCSNVARQDALFVVVGARFTLP